MSIVALIEDDRQKGGKHDTKHRHWDEMGVEVVRHRMEVGDYAPVPRVSVDTKKDLVEFAGNLRTDHERFRAECVRASEIGCQLVVLVENNNGIKSLSDLERWRESASSVRRRHGKKPYDGAVLAKQCRTMRTKYGVMFDFCTPDESARRVLEILERGEEWVWRNRLSSTREGE